MASSSRLPTSHRQLPGCFVVLQGTPGDGMSNTIEMTPFRLPTAQEDVGDSNEPNEVDDEHEEAPAFVSGVNLRPTEPPSVVSEITEPSTMPRVTTDPATTILSELTEASAPNQRPMASAPSSARPSLPMSPLPPNMINSNLSHSPDMSVPPLDAFTDVPVSPTIVESAGSDGPVGSERDEAPTDATDPPSGAESDESFVQVALPAQVPTASTPATFGVASATGLATPVDLSDANDAANDATADQSIYKDSENATGPKQPELAAASSPARENVTPDDPLPVPAEPPDASIAQHEQNDDPLPAPLPHPDRHATLDRDLSTADLGAIETWNDKCRRTELRHREEWLENTEHQQRGLSLAQASLVFPSREKSHSWWAPQGQLAVFDSSILDLLPNWFRGVLPMEPTVFPTAMLAPGMTVIGTEVVTLDLCTWEFVQEPEDDCGSFTPARHDTLQMLWIDSPHTGYIVLSINGYSFLGPGLAGAYIDPDVFFWRVTCQSGAVVRDTLRLSSKSYVTTIPYGSIVKVTRKTVNEDGLCRLKVTAEIESSDEGSPHETRMVQGWCSEFLNPFSGQNGSILEPLPFPLPALYRVVWEKGAVIRSGVELSSPNIGLAPYGATLSIVSRTYTEHPRDKCILRLCLAGNGGWISLRLCDHPPNDAVLVECIRLDDSFEPERPGLFHLDALRNVQESKSEESRILEQPTSVESQVTSTLSDNDQRDAVASSSSSEPREAVSYHSLVTNHSDRIPGKSDLCSICRTRERNATLVHGETGHIVSCLLCARIMKARGDPCPVCRCPVDSVIQHFWA